MIFYFWAGFNAQVIYAQRYLDKERSPAKYRAFFLPWAWEKSNQFGTYRLLKRIRKASVHSHWSWHAVNILEYLVGNSIVLTGPFVLWPHFSCTIAEDVLSINGPSLTIWFGSRKHSKYLPQHSPSLLISSITVGWSSSIYAYHQVFFNVLDCAGCTSARIEY